MEPRSPSECLYRFTSRFFLNLRRIVHHQRVSVFDSHPQPFELSPVRTRTIHKHSDRPMTSDFVDMEMRETVSSSGACPNDEGLEQADIIHLKVIDSKAHRQRR